MNLRPLEELVTDYHNAKVELWDLLKQRLQTSLEAGNARRETVRSPEALHVYKEEMKKFLLRQIGGFPPSPEGTPPATMTGEIQRPGFTIQKIILETRPGVLASTNLYLPHGLAEKRPAILFLCGHNLSAKARYQTIAQVLVQMGFIVLVLDPTGQGERLGYFTPSNPEPLFKRPTAEHEYSGVQCLLQGHNLTRYLLHDAVRAVDFLAAHDAVDPTRLGLTGSSGGGTQTALMMLVDPRIAAAAPGTFITSFESIFSSGMRQDSEQIWPGFAGAGYDHLDLLAAFAPKPLCVLAVTYDFFPIEGTRESVSRAQRFWNLFGCEDRLELVEDARTHGYSRFLADRAGTFLARHLGLAPRIPAHEAVVEPLPEKELWCTQKGQLRLEFPESKTVFDENQAAFSQRQRDSDASRASARAFLESAVKRHRVATEPNLRVVQEGRHGPIRYRLGFWRSQPGLHNSGILLQKAGSEKECLPVTIAVWEDGSRNLIRHDAWIRETVGEGRAVLVLNVSGMGPLEPISFRRDFELKGPLGSFFRINDDFIALGDSFAALRVHDILQSVKALEQWGGLDLGDIQLYAEGKYGIYSAFASEIEPGLKRFHWDNPMPTYGEMLQNRFYDDYDVKSLIIPGLLAYCDWPDLVPTIKGSENLS